jgi:hypothetical protein
MAGSVTKGDSAIKCVRYEYCKRKIPNSRVAAAESRGKKALYCSNECRHTEGVKRWRLKLREKRQPGKRKKTAA